MAELKHINADEGSAAVVKELLSSGGVIVDGLLLARSTSSSDPC